MNDPYGSVRRMLLINMLVIPFLPFLLVILCGGYYFYTSVENNTIASMNRIVSDHRHIIEFFLQERKSDLALVLDTYPAQQLSESNQLHRILLDLHGKSPAFADIGFFDDTGTHLAYWGPYQLSGKIYSDELWFRQVLKKGWYISDVFLGYRKKPHFIIAVAKNDGDRKWVLRATIDSHVFTDLVEQVRIGKTGEAYILDKNGYFQTEQRSGGLLMTRDPEHASPPNYHPGIKTFIQTDRQGHEFLYATTWLKSNDWQLVVRQEKADAFKSLHIATLFSLIICALSGMLIIPLAFYSAGRITRRMEKMDAAKDLLEKQLIGASRLAELGEMAAGFAHEINNPLQIMKSEKALIDMVLAEVLKGSEANDSEDMRTLFDSLNQIDLQINRCAKITQGILKFGRQGDPAPQHLVLQQFIPEITAMIEKKAELEGIRIHQAVQAKTPTVHADAGQLQQVLLNLYNNAIDAIIDQKSPAGGKITIQAGPDKDQNVEISVADTGIGIRPENLEKVFKPFFTTKPVGKGTGLGLSVCYGIIQSMGGKLGIASDPGIGTTFTITLPASQPARKN